jgi:indole-3-glycerol phosphate synthase
MTTTLRLAPFIPEGCVIIGESGINSEKDIRALIGTRINAVLVGSALMKDNDIEEKTAGLVKAGQ